MIMKRVFFAILIMLFFVAGYGFTTISETEIVQEYKTLKVPAILKSSSRSVVFPRLPETEVEIVGTPEKPTAPYVSQDYTAFKEALAFKESRGKYNSINTLGYMGKYQFGAGTLALLGIYDTLGFISDPKLQEMAFDANTSRNKWVLRRDIKRYVGSTIDGILITESGMLAAAHLAGPGNVKKFVRSNGVYQVTDAYGTSLQDYLTIFAGYMVGTVVPHRSPKVN